MPPDDYRLVIGNKNTSSWSLRPWLLLAHCGLSFREVRINLRGPDRKEQLFAHSPAGKVPVLLHGDLLIWDSLAIAEYLAERHPEAGLWPEGREARAVARAASAEMHSGFQALREHCPMDFLGRAPKAEVNETVALNVGRIVSLWGDCRRRYGGDGPFLFSRFSIADAMYAPVASRLRTYLPDLSLFGDDGTAQRYVDTLMELPAMRRWGDEASIELAEYAKV